MRFEHEDSEYYADDLEHVSVTRISKTILRYALYNGAQAVSYTQAGKSVSISYQIRDKWHPQWAFPMYVHAPILEFYRNWFSAKNTLRLGFEEVEHQMSLRYQITAHWKSNEQNEDLIMRIEWDADDLPEMQEPEVKL